MTNIITLVRASVFRDLLVQANYNPIQTEFIFSGFSKGFELGSEGPHDVKITTNNLPIRCGSRIQHWNKIAKEVNLKHFAGPFETIPFSHYIQSPTGLVPKASSGDDMLGQVGVRNTGSSVMETRLIFHLSLHKKASVNYHTPKDKCRVKYKDFDQAVRLCLKTGWGCYMVKSDMKSAFHNLPIRPQDLQWLVMMTVYPITGKRYYFFDKAVPFGSGISCCHFQRVSNAIEAVLRFRTKHKSINYLDDFFFISLSQVVCNGIVHNFLDLCHERLIFQWPMRKLIGLHKWWFFLGNAGRLNEVNDWRSRKQETQSTENAQ